MAEEISIPCATGDEARAHIGSHSWLLDAALQAAADGIMIVDRDGYICWVNPAFTRITGYTPAEALGQNPRILKSGVQDEAFYHHVWDTILAGQSWTGEVINRRKNGTYYAESQTITPVRDDRGAITHFIAIMQDTTSRKQAENALRESERRFRAAFEQTFQFMAILDVEGMVLEANQITLDFAGLTADEIQGRPLWGSQPISVPDEARERMQAAVAQAARGELARDELHLVGADGQVVTFDFSVKPLTDEEHRVLMLIAEGRDVTDRQRAEYRAQEHAERAEALAAATQTLAEAGPEIQAVLESVARVAAQILGDVCLVYQLSVDGRRFLPVACYHRNPESLARLEEAIAASAGSDGHGPFAVAADSIAELGTWTEPGYWRHLEDFDLAHAIIMPMRAQNRMFGMLLVGRSRGQAPYDDEDRETARSLADRAGLAITNANLYGDLERTLHEEQVMRMHVAQAEKHAAIGHMVASIAHELNNPLQTLKGCLFLIRQDTAPDSPIHEYLDMASSETQRLARLVSQLRESYRPTRPEPMSSVDLHTVIRDTHALLALHLQYHQVEWRQAALRQGFIVHGTTDQLKQVFLNLGLNAIEAMQPGGGTLEVNLDRSPNGTEAQVTFRDTGPGIAPEDLPRLFEPLFTTKESGTGLGLPICRDIVHKHGGRITVDSHPGAGAAFTVWLPLAAAPEG